MKGDIHLRHPLGFLTPRVSSVFLTVVLVVLFLPFIRYDNGIRCFTVPCNSSDLASVVGYALFHNQQPVIGTAWEFLIIGVFGTYFVISLMHTTARVRRKKNRARKSK